MVIGKQKLAEFELDIVVIGAQRAGSTNLADELSLHSRVDLPGLELPVFEPKFFSDASLRVLTRYYSRDSLGVRALKRPDYLANAQAARNLASVYPGCQIVVVLREPVERFLSAAYWYQYVGLIPVMPLGEVVERTREIGDDAVTAALAGNPFGQLLSCGLYGRHLAVYRDLFPEGAIHIFYHDEVLTAGSRRYAASQVLESFPNLGGSWAEGVGTRRNAGVYNSRRLRFLSSRPMTFNWEIASHFEHVDNRLRRTPVRSAVSAAYHVTDRKVLARIFQDNRPEKLSRQHSDWLTSKYQEDLSHAPWLNLPASWLNRYEVK